MVIILPTLDLTDRLCCGMLVVMRRDHPAIGWKEVLGLILLLITLSGCASFIGMETPRTLPQGEVNLLLAGVKAEDEDEGGNKFGFGVLKARIGSKMPLDLGARLDVPYLGVMVDAKYQVLQSDRHGLDLAFLGGTGIPSLFHFQAILGRQIGPLQIYASYRYLLTGSSKLDASLTIDDLEHSIQQGFAGIRLDLMKNLFCQGEGGFMWEQDIFIIGVGCGMAFSAI